MPQRKRASEISAGDCTPSEPGATGLTNTDSEVDRQTKFLTAGICSPEGEPEAYIRYTRLHDKSKYLVSRRTLLIEATQLWWSSPWDECVYLLVLLIAAIAAAPTAFAQTAPVLPAYAQAESGETRSISVTSGSKSSISFSNTSSLSSSVSTSASSGTITSATSSYKPKGSFSSKISDSLIPSSGISISTDNLSGSSSNINGTTESNKTSSAKVTGLESTIDLSFDSENEDAAINADASITENATGDYMTGNAGSGLNLSNNLSTEVETSSFSSSFMSAF